ncbi:MAG: MFS transporter [Burkholderiaceae bacterium]|nr:MAG: MFS transporter [Burkholderiaceae bacterium]TAM01219.1 MAG: MFS transporter [Pusillimonas sp.]
MPSSPQNDAAASPKTLSTPTLVLMAVACGLTVGGNYFNQPLLHSIAIALNVGDATAAASVTVAQVAYALGLLFLVPLGDKVEHKRLVIGLMLLTALGQFISGFAVNIAMLFIGTAMAGLFSVAAAVLVPMAAALSAPSQSGRAVGLVMSGLLTGILLARSVSGLLSGLGGWDTAYRLSAVTMVVVSWALWRSLPYSRNPKRLGYVQMLASMLVLVREQPRLRSRSLLGGLSFGSISALFSTMALMLAGPAHRMSDVEIGLIGLAGVAGAVMANVAGKLADRGWGKTITATCTLLLIMSWATLWVGTISLWWFILGMTVSDLAVQGIHINNQTIIYTMLAHARSRANAVYMTVYFIGGASGSALGAAAWGYDGWTGACGVGLMMALLTALALWYDEAVVKRTPLPQRVLESTDRP